MTHYDFIVIGSGAGGGTLANVLARQGKNVLVLERGGWLKREPQNMDPREVFVKGRYVSRDTWLLNGKPSQPGVHYNVGGATKFYGAALFRLRPKDFRGGVQHTDGVTRRWPVSYSDMEPWYSLAEQMYQVHGNGGEDPTGGFRSQGYPYPAVSHSPHLEKLSGQLAAAGYRPFHAPAAVMLNEQRPELSACMRCNFCDGHPCITGAKADAETIGIRPVMDLPNVTLVTNAVVTELVAYRGAVRQVMTVQGDRIVTYSADTVILAAGAVNTAKILLSSDRIGIANSSGQVGRNYMFHRSRAVMSIGPERNDTVFQKTLAVNDFYWPDEARGVAWPLGGIQMVGKSSAGAMRGESKLARYAPAAALGEMASHAVDWWLTTEDLPLPGNRVTLDSQDRVVLTVNQTGKRESDLLYGELKRMLAGIGHYGFASHAIGIDGVAHQAGTARMGDDPATSVVDANMKAHDLDNLYIADASVFASIGAVNPALTVMALALRLGDHLS